MSLNNDIQDQHDTLVAAVSTLSDRLSVTNDPTEAKKIGVEMQQLTARINLLQSLLFVQETTTISQQTQSITSAKAQLDKDVETQASWTNVVNDLNAMVAAADTTIQVAKALLV